MRRWSVVPILLVSALLIAACGSTSDDVGGAAGGPGATTAPAGDGAPDDGDADEGPEVVEEIVIGFHREPDSMDNLLDRGSVTGALPTSNIHEALVHWTPDGELVPLLAAEMPEQQADDPLRWRVRLREGVTFSNGEPFNADAVVANVTRMFEDEYVLGQGGGPIGDITTLESAEVVDEYTVDFITSVPDGQFALRLFRLPFGAPEVMAADSEAYGRDPVGTGAYMLESWDRGQQYTLVANPNYWGDPPQIQRIVVREIPDEGTRLAALQSGEVAIASAISPDRAGEVPKTISSPGFPETLLVRLNFNPEFDSKEPVGDANFRRALNYAVNKQAIVDSIYEGQFGVPQCQAWGEGTFGYHADLEAYPYDPDRAQELLEQVDIPEDFTFQVALGATTAVPRVREVALAVVSDLQAVGINAEFITLDTTQHSESVRRTGFVPDGHMLPPNNQWGSPLRFMENYLYGPAPIVGTVAPDAYPELNSLIEQAAQEGDPDELAAIFRQIWEMACDEALVLWLTDVRDIWGAAENIHYEHQGVGYLADMELRRVQVR